MKVFAARFPLFRRCPRVHLQNLHGVIDELVPGAAGWVLGDFDGRRSCFSVLAPFMEPDIPLFQALFNAVVEDTFGFLTVQLH